MDTHQSLRARKWRLEKKLFGWCMLEDLNLVVKSTLPPLFYKIATTWCRITNMPLLGPKCGFIHLDDVEMVWK